MDVPGDEGLLMWSVYQFQLRSGWFSWFCDFAWNKLFSFCCFKWRQVSELRLTRACRSEPSCRELCGPLCLTHLRPPRCELCDQGRVHEEKERKAGSSLLSVKCPFVIPGTWVPRGHNQDRLCCSLLPLCGQQVSWLTRTLILSTGWKRFPRGNWSSWKRWLSWKRGRSGQTRRKGNRHILFLLLIVISSPCTVLFTLVFIILHFITKFLFKWKSRH